MQKHCLSQDAPGIGKYVFPANLHMHQDMYDTFGDMYLMTLVHEFDFFFNLFFFFFNTISGLNFDSIL